MLNGAALLSGVCFYKAGARAGKGKSQGAGGAGGGSAAVIRRKQVRSEFVLI